MAPSAEPLLPHKKKDVGVSKASMIYTADGYFEQLRDQLQKEAPEIAEICSAMHDSGGSVNKAVVSLNEEGRSHLTNRLFPESKTPEIEGKQKHLAFLFTKLKDEEALYMWKIMTLIFITLCAMVIGYGAALRHFGSENWKTVTVCFGVPFAW